MYKFLPKLYVIPPSLKIDVPAICVSIYFVSINVRVSSTIIRTHDWVHFVLVVLKMVLQKFCIGIVINSTVTQEEHCSYSVAYCWNSVETVGYKCFLILIRKSEQK